jgi:spermidine/putrescine transport system permease protein
MAEMALPAGRRISARRFDLKRIYGFGTVAAACLAALYAPILILFAFSFNGTRSVTAWSGFSWDWYPKAFLNDKIWGAALNTMQIAIFATIVSTIIATAAALATTRTKPWRGQTASYMTINLPLMVPEIVTAIATLSFFGIVAAMLGSRLGIIQLMLAHTCFCIPFAYMPIRARLEDMDLTLEQAAADLYATPWRTFRRVTLPLLMPGIVAGATLAFVVSFDDFTITSMLVGPGETTLPMYVWTSIRRGISPEINAMSTILLVISILLVSLSFLIGRKKY